MAGFVLKTSLTLYCSSNDGNFSLISLLTFSLLFFLLNAFLIGAMSSLSLIASINPYS